MKSNRKMLMVMFAIVFVLLLAACENASEEWSTTFGNQSQNNNLSQDANDDSESSNVASSVNATNTDNANASSLDADNNVTSEEMDTSINAQAKDEDLAINNATVVLKEEYLEKLNNTKKELEEVQAEDSSTYAMKKVAGDRYDVWDELLNDVYGVLMEQLSTEEMDQLRKEQRNWIKDRDDTAKAASLKYEGGTQEHLEYVTVLANLTEERCYELVEDYMNEHFIPVVQFYGTK
ncbi:lysozyme inhibitor LprI family protein [Oceanobacillus bengalensis]|uniref:DUF1311 domain-containing protein n=2 Tax=Oceanobacillus bengalensis TaxID=1435466 RepID=A0A494YZ51_9BACI|nr:lysozyme inhibitor LprI family protein [Oceanobacillus bengalensis]RKQ15525.1 DUF1311 domain-containing protein [Oceanobacillus bengalensis]